MGQERREQAAQLIMVGFQGVDPPDDAWRFLEELPPAGVLLFKQNIASQDKLAAVLREIQERTRRPGAPPLLVGIDQEGGRVVRLTEEIGFRTFPAAGALAAEANALHRVREAASSTALGLKRLGINMNFAPVLDVVTDPCNRVIGDRSYGNTPERVTCLGLAVMEEHQRCVVAATAKHFPGHGPTAVDSHLDLPVIGLGLEELEQTHFPPFHAAVEAGVAAVMTAHAVYPALDPDQPATLSHPILTGLLREKWGFEGVICTDSLTMQAIARRGTVPEACVRSFEAGADLLMVPSSPALHRECVEALASAMETGRLSRERVEASLARLGRMREQYS